MQASQWCDQARGLCEDPESDGLDSLANRLDAIGAGLRLRRQLDVLGPDEPAESSRRAVVRRLTELQVLADFAMDALAPGTPRSHNVADRVKDWLADTRLTLRKVLTGLRLGSLHQAMAIEGLRTDLEWLSAVVARLDRETPHPVTVWLDVELGRLRGWLGTPASRDPDPRDEPLRAGCERLQAVVLERRVGRELARPMIGSSPEVLWAQRFQLSRLQAQVDALELASGESPARSRLAQDRVLWLDSLSRRRAELADAADDRLTALELTARASPASSSSGRPSTRSVRRSPFSRTCSCVARSGGSSWCGMTWNGWSSRAATGRVAIRSVGSTSGPAVTAEFRPGHDLGPTTTARRTMPRPARNKHRMRLSSRAGSDRTRKTTGTRRPPTCCDGRRGGSNAGRARCAASGRRSCWPCGWNRSSAAGSSRSWKTRCWS